MNSAPAGATVNVRAGTYHERLSVNVSGTADAPVVFQPYGFSAAASCGGHTGATCPGDAVVLDYAYLGTVTDGVPFLHVNSQSYVKIQGFTFQNFSTRELNYVLSQGVRIAGSAHHVEIAKSRFLRLKELGPWDGTTALAAFRMWRGTHHIVIDGNELGDFVTTYGEALTVDGGATDITLSNNWIHDTDAIGIDIHGEASAIVKGNLLEYIGKRRSDGYIWYGNAAQAIYIDGGINTIIEGNVVRDSCNAIGVDAEPNEPAAHDIIFRNNVMYRNMQGLKVGNWYTNDNLWRIYNVTVVNNTVVDCGDSVVIRPASNVTWKNNVIVGGNGYINTGGWATGAMDYNLWSRVSRVGPGSHNLTADPQFTNAGGGDYSLGGSSPAGNAGDSGVAAAAGQVDFLGNPRVVSGQIDLGAYESR